jgi:hypothetical protein
MSIYTVKSAVPLRFAKDSYGRCMACNLHMDLHTASLELAYDLKREALATRQRDRPVPVILGLCPDQIRSIDKARAGELAQGVFDGSAFAAFGHLSVSSSMSLHEHAYPV